MANATLQQTVSAIVSLVVNDKLPMRKQVEAWRLLTSNKNLNHPLLHRLRHRWAEAVAGGDPALLLAAEAVVAALVLATGGWTSAGVEPSDVTRVLAEVVEPRRT